MRVEMVVMSTGLWLIMFIGIIFNVKTIISITLVVLWDAYSSFPRVLKNIFIWFNNSDTLTLLRDAYSSFP